MVKLYTPSVGARELKAIKKTFDEGWIGKGKVEQNFRTEIGKALVEESYYGAVAVTVSPDRLLTVNSCTEGLFQCMEALNLTPGDEVITPAINFIGVANAIIANNGTPVFCDVDRRTLNVGAEDIRRCVTDKTKAVIIVHYGGRPCNMDQIVKICNEMEIDLIEDNANSPFSKYGGQSTGTFGKCGIWSFDAMKMLTMGDGGMIYTRDSEFYQKLKSNTYLGLQQESGLSNPIDSRWWEFNIDRPGRRSIINDIQASIGLAQLSRMKRIISLRKIAHKLYSDLIEENELPLLPPPPIKAGYISSYYMYHVQCNNTLHRDNLSKFLRSKNIYTSFRYFPLDQVEYLKKYSREKLPNTEHIKNVTLCLPLHHQIPKQFEYISKTILEYYGKKEK